MEQEAGHFLAAKLASVQLVEILRLGHCRNDVQITNGAAVAGGRKDRREFETDAVVRSPLEGFGQTI